MAHNNDYPPPHILLADDDKDDCLMFKEVLEELSLRTNLTTVHDGEQLLQFLIKGTDELPTVLFLDLNMPRKNGLECLKEIKRSEKLKTLPVVIISTSYNENAADLLYKNGAHHYICKPVDFPQLKYVICKAIKLVEQETNSQPSKDKFLLNNVRGVIL